MNEAVAVHAPADAGFIQKSHRALFDNARANPAEHIVGRLPLQNDIVDAMTMQKLPEQKTCRPSADDGDLRSPPVKHPSRPQAASLPPAIMIDERFRAIRSNPK